MDGEWFRWTASILVTVGGLILAGLLRRIFSMIDGKANKDSTDKRFDQVMSELKDQRRDMKDHASEDREMHNDVVKELRMVNSNLATTNANLANLAGRFEANGH